MDSPLIAARASRGAVCPGIKDLALAVKNPDQSFFKSLPAAVIFLLLAWVLTPRFHAPKNAIEARVYNELCAAYQHYMRWPYSWHMKLRCYVYHKTGRWPSWRIGGRS
jgi:hypothetical protein